jgi:hypothetical protein
MLDTLPRESFVRVRVRQLAKPRVIWSGGPNSLERIEKTYGWCCPLPGEPEDAYSDEATFVLAERYGGQGIGVNGGGVRCGWHSGMQVKGTGPSQLAGDGASYWHSYGGASVREAVREAIWGEVFNAALPHGAVRVQAIISTGTTVPLHYPDHLGNSTCGRALIVRPAFLRPAHYLRSAFFRPARGFLDEYPTDTTRTRAAVLSLRQGLAVSLGGFEGDSLPDLLGPACVRYAEQIAAARAKRLLHGSLSPSNIALDGRFLDFGMSSAVSDHGRIVVARGCPDAWQQHGLLIQGIDDLAFYIDKYADEGIGYIALRNYLRKVFLDALTRRFAIELVKLSGLPEMEVAALPHVDFAATASVFNEVISAGNREPFKLLCPCPDYVPQMPHRMGRYHIGTCIDLATGNDSPVLADAALSAELPDAKLRQRFVEAIFMLRATYLNRLEGEASQRALDFLRLNAIRINASLEALYSYSLNRRIDEAMTSFDDLGAFIERTVRGVAGRLREPTNGEIRFAFDDGREAVASPTSGLSLSGRSTSWQALRGHLPTPCASA